MAGDNADELLGLVDNTQAALARYQQHPQRIVDTGLGRNAKAGIVGISHFARV